MRSLTFLIQYRPLFYFYYKRARALYAGRDQKESESGRSGWSVSLSRAAADGDMSQVSPVIVEGDWGLAEASKVRIKLELYFGSQKKSSGGECRVQTEDGAPRAAVYFVEAAGECEPAPPSQTSQDRAGNQQIVERTLETPRRQNFGENVCESLVCCAMTSEK